MAANRLAISLGNGTPLSCRVVEQASTPAFGQLPVVRQMSDAATERPVKQKSNHKAEATIRLRIYDFAGLEPVVLAVLEFVISCSDKTDIGMVTKAGVSQGCKFQSLGSRLHRVFPLPLSFCY